MKHNHAAVQCSGATLMELLGVMAIIIIIMGIIIPGSLAVKRGAQRKEALTRATILASAARQYFNAYSRWPAQSQGNIDITFTDNTPVIDALTNNPRQLIFLETTDQLIENGFFADPWGSSIVIAFDMNHDGYLDILATNPVNTSSILSTNIRSDTAALSWGSNPNNHAKRIYSW